jgi:hypothetical protein
VSEDKRKAIRKREERRRYKAAHLVSVVVQASDVCFRETSDLASRSTNTTADIEDFMSLL